MNGSLEVNGRGNPVALCVDPHELDDETPVEVPRLLEENADEAFAFGELHVGRVRDGRGQRVRELDVGADDVRAGEVHVDGTVGIDAGDVLTRPGDIHERFEPHRAAGCVSNPTDAVATRSVGQRDGAPVGIAARADVHRIEPGMRDGAGNGDAHRNIHRERRGRTEARIGDARRGDHASSRARRRRENAGGAHAAAGALVSDARVAEALHRDGESETFACEHRGTFGTDVHVAAAAAGCASRATRATSTTQSSDTAAARATCTGSCATCSRATETTSATRAARTSVRTTGAARSARAARSAIRTTGAACTSVSSKATRTRRATDACRTTTGARCAAHSAGSARATGAARATRRRATCFAFAALASITALASTASSASGRHSRPAAVGSASVFAAAAGAALALAAFTSW